MGYLNNLYKIFKGTVAGDKTGTPARTAAQGINDNMDAIDNAMAAIDTASEKKVNKVPNLDAVNDTTYPTSKAVKDYSDGKEIAANNFTSSQLGSYQAKSEKGIANGYMGLDANGFANPANLPGTVPEIIEGTYINSTTFNDDLGSPVTPEKAKIYMDVAVNPVKQYRWGGSKFGEINPNVGLTDDLAEGTTNLYFSGARVLATVLAGLDTLTALAVNSGDTILVGIGKLQAQFNTISTSIGNKLDKGTYTGNAGDLKSLIDAKETPLAAQAKADTAETNAKAYADTLLKETIAGRYATYAAMIADQANQVSKGVYAVADASGFSTVDAGYADFEYLGTTLGTEADYRKLSEEESMDIVAGGVQSVTGTAVDNTDPNNPVVNIPASGADVRLANLAADLNTTEKDAIKSKLGVAAGGGGATMPVSKTGQNIVFTEDAFYNEITPLVTGDLTLDLTGAVKGVLSIVYCDRYIPAISGSDYLITGQFSANKLNELWFFNNGVNIDLSVIGKSYLTTPVNFTVISSNSENLLSSYGTLYADSYELLFSTTNDILTASSVPAYNGADTSYTHTGVSAGTTYFYWVRAKGKGLLHSEYETRNITTTSGGGFSTANLLGFYKADETSGTVATDSFSANNGVLNNVFLGTTGKIGKAYSFNGSTSFIDFTALNGKVNNTNFTVGCWIKTTQTSTYRLWQNRGAGGIGTVKGYQLSPAYLSSYDNTYIDNGAGASTKFDNVTYNEGDGLWHLVGLSFNAATGRVRLVIDGVINEKINSALIGANLNGVGTTFGKSNANNQYYNGLADEMFFYQRELTQSDWNDLYNAGSGRTL